MSEEDNLNHNNLQCAICFDEEDDLSIPQNPGEQGSRSVITFARLPCCGQADQTSTIKVCTACILVLTNPTSDGRSRVGRCPRCRSWINVRTPASTENPQLEITAIANAGQCVICRQVKEHLVVEGGSVCNACFLGIHHLLLYECKNCHESQRIAHPMYRYQADPNEFGTVTWACHGRCGDFTCWRIQADQVGLIPVGEAPAAWGDDLLETARNRVQQTRHA
jgi:hypothetical protein